MLPFTMNGTWTQIRYPTTTPDETSNMQKDNIGGRWNHITSAMSYVAGYADDKTTNGNPAMSYPAIQNS